MRSSGPSKRLVQRLRRALRARQQRMLSFASALVRIATENPPGAHYDECVALMKDELERCGIAARDVLCRSAAASAGRRSVIAEVGTAGPLLYFHGHYDAVPAQERRQFTPTRRGGRLIGRGTADTKSGLAMMVHTVGALAEAGLLGTGRVALVMVPDEETAGELGTAALARGGYLQSDATGMLTPEPSGGVIWHASRAALTLRVTVRGRAAHVALSQAGASAFTAMTRLAARLSRLEAQVASRRTSYRIRPSSAARSILLVGGQCAVGTNFNIAEGRFEHIVLPRILGRDFAGRVADGPPELVGLEVYGSGGDLGISRDGTHAEFVALPRDALALRPTSLSFEQAAAAGVPFVTAWTAMISTGQLTAGEWVIVSGAAGAVGGAATQLAVARGGRVIALVRDDAEAGRLDRQQVAAVAQSDRNDFVDVVRSATGGRGADLALNGVGAAIFQPMLDAPANGGALVVYSAAGGREVTLDLLAFYHRRLRLSGIDTVAENAVSCAQILSEVTPLFQSSALRPLPIVERYPLSEAGRAYARVATGAPGKIVLIPDRLFKP